MQQQQQQVNLQPQQPMTTSTSSTAWMQQPLHHQAPHRGSPPQSQPAWMGSVDLRGGASNIPDLQPHTIGSVNSWAGPDPDRHSGASSPQLGMDSRSGAGVGGAVPQARLYEASGPVVQTPTLPHAEQYLRPLSAGRASATAGERSQYAGSQPQASRTAAVSMSSLHTSATASVAERYRDSSWTERPLAHEPYSHGLGGNSKVRCLNSVLLRSCLGG